MLTRRAALFGSIAGVAVSGVAAAQNAPTTLLQLKRRTIEVNGKSASVFGISQPNGTSGIITEKGKPFRVRVENMIDEPSLIHWHGLTPPSEQDGLPGISAPAISPGGSADYDFPLRFGGTFWMHSHQGFQEQLLMSAPLIIHDQRDQADQQEIVVMLADFSFTPPEQIMEQLRKAGGMSAMGGSTTTASAHGGMAMSGSMSMPGMANMPSMNTTPGMAMGGMTNPPDLNDVKYDAFLANDRTLADPQIIKVEPGGRVLLRVINSSSMSSYHLDLGQLDGELIAVDGFQVSPIKARSFPLSVAQRLDIRLAIPRVPATYPVLAILEGERNQTGVVLVAGNAPITRITDTAKTALPALTLDLEAQLRATEPLQPRKADRTHTIDLTGQMAGYVWSINNVVWSSDTPPLPVSKGERVELVMSNKTPMPHPMHLHGHEFQVVEIDGKRFSGAVRDTVLVPPGRRVVVAFDADNPGHWAFHCHLLYHMEAGMFATLQYA